MQKKTRSPFRWPAGAAANGARPGPRKPAKALQPLRKTQAPGATLAIRKLKAELRQARARIAELQASAETDFLLDILNRRGFARELTRASAFMARYGATGALVVLDVDRLKPINDTYGHAAGDAVLKAVVDVLRSHVRASDVIGRLGGDEFVLLLWNLTEADAQAKARALEAAIDGLSITFGDAIVSAGASAGVAPLGAAIDSNAALVQADQAMYARKTARRVARSCA